MAKNIRTYKDLIKAKKELKEEISTAETSIMNSKLLRVSGAVLDGKSLKGPLLDSLSSLDLKSVLASPLGSLASTFLLSNKFIRKYFVAYTILKETIPYAFTKISEMLDQTELSKKSK